MSLHEDYEDLSSHEPNEYHYKEDDDSLTHRRKIRRMLEDRLERKRLKEECMDDFDELSGDFDWDILDK